MARSPASTNARGHHNVVASARLKALFTSLGLRLLVPLLLVAATVLAIHAYFSFRSTKEQFIRFAASEADRSSGFIRRATHDGMLLNRLDDVQATIEQFAQEPEIAVIRIYDKQGTIVLSSERSDVGRRIALRAPVCAQCHAIPQAGHQAASVARAVDAKVVRQLTALDKESACVGSGCHDPRASQSVLGVLEVEMSMQPLKRALAATRLRLIWTTLGLMLVFGLAATLIVRAHHEWMRWSQTLEEKVVEKTAELQAAQQQVLHMEKMASLGKLSATVAHELNNPITGMLTYARLIERELADQPLPDDIRAELQTWLHLVQQECSRCGSIVKNLLVFARNNTTDMMPVDVNEVVKRSLMLIKHQLDINGIRAETHYLTAHSEIVADPGQLEQALVALLINAAEAMSKGGQLSVRLRGDTDGVDITIGDTGTGIPADVLQQIFEPFFTTKHNESGAGLGLAVVYGIVHRHGGTIEVQSTVGDGTTFHLRFPRQPPATDAARELDAHVEAAGVLV